MDFIKSLLLSIFHEQVDDLNRFAADKTHKLLVLSFVKQISSFLFSISFVGVILSLSLHYGAESITKNSMTSVLWSLGPIMLITGIFIKAVLNRSRIESIFESKAARKANAINVLEIVEAVRQVKEAFSSPIENPSQVDKKFSDIDQSLVSVADAIAALNDKIEKKTDLRDLKDSNHLPSFQ
jgi:hypothetical protein